jgi:uncharacterized protein (TIGR03437 family)
MGYGLRVVVSGFLACAGALAQTAHHVEVCDWSGCQSIDSSVMGGVGFEDCKVTNPSAVQFDPAQRMKELAALGPSIADALSQAPPTFTTPAPTITFDPSSVVGQIYWVPIGPEDGAPFEFMDVQFSNFAASNGYTSPHFGFRMIREVVASGAEASWFNIQIQAGNAGLTNIPGLPSGVGFQIDTVGQTASVFGTVPSSELLREAVLGVFVNAQAILNAAKFTVTVPAPPGSALWSSSELASLAGQSAPWIEAAASTNVPVGPPFTCTVANSSAGNGYGACTGQSEIDAFANMLLAWGGEYLELRTQESFNILVSNLRTWATAQAPSIDPAYAASNPGAMLGPTEEIAMPLTMLWPTLRADPGLSAADQATIDNWLESWLMPPLPAGGNVYYPNDLGYFADSILMGDAIRRSDSATFALGVEGFYGALAQMRTDGSFPLASALSACSATYSNLDLVHLVAMAEMAATQGYDLYSMNVGGKSLETAIEFMLNAYQNPALLYQYSQAGQGVCFEGKPGDPPDFTVFSTPGPALAWMESYLARFPLSATAARLNAILGTNVNASPFPLMLFDSGLNTTGAFRKWYEFQPVSGANVAVVTGDGQTVAANQPAPMPLSVQVTDNTGKALAGTLVSFAVVQGSANVVAPAQLLTDTNGMASAGITMGPASGPVTVTAKALGSAASFSFTVPGPAPFNGGVVGIGASVPAVTAISPGALFSIYGNNFVPADSGGTVTSSQIVNGSLPTSLFGVCVTVGGVNAPLLGVYPGQINAVAPSNINVSGLPPDAAAPYIGIIGSTEVIVITGCGTAGQAQSMPQMVAVQTAAPEFLYFSHNANGQNPVAAVNSLTGAYVGPTSLGASFAPAQPGGFVSIFASGFGPTSPAITPGTFASGAAPVTMPVTVTLGSVTLDPSDVLYAGAAPGELISQLNIRIPAGTPAGNLSIQIQIAGIASPPGAFLAITAPSN